MLRGLLNPVLVRRGWSADRLVKWGMPLSMLVLAVNIAAGPDAGWLGWALFCVASSVMGLAQPAVGMAFPPALAGRALSGYNLVIFSGVFVVQWGLGLLIDLEPKDTLAGAAAYTRSIRIDGIGRGGKLRDETLEIRSLNNARAARGRKGKVADLGFKPAAVRRVE